MSRRFAQLVARVRLARHRCPACRSEAVDGCTVCLGYAGPHPADAMTLRRWARRFETQLWSGAAPREPAWRPAETARAA